MDQALVMDLIRDALWVVISTAAPLLLLALIVGLMVSIFQTTTSIQEPTLAFVPKILAVFIGMLIFGPYMLGRLKEFIIILYTSFPLYIK